MYIWKARYACTPDDRREIRRGEITSRWSSFPGCPALVRENRSRVRSRIAISATWNLAWEPGTGKREREKEKAKREIMVMENVPKRRNPEKMGGGGNRFKPIESGRRAKGRNAARRQGKGSAHNFIVILLAAPPHGGITESRVTRPIYYGGISHS